MPRPDPRPGRLRGGRPAASPATADGTRPPAIHWVRSSAEHRAVFLQIYRHAARAVAEREGAHPDGGWGVIVDADETTLDNSEYQRRRAALGLGYTVDSWNDWVREAAAPALPGAAEFLALVRSLGGRVVVVTNRDEEVCDATRRNLAAVAIAPDAVLCRAPGPSTKDARFESVRRGTAGLPPLEVLAWVGDNIQDFPGMGQEAARGPAAALAPFGETWFLLPNPMYGSWERLPPG